MAAGRKRTRGGTFGGAGHGKAGGRKAPPPHVNPPGGYRWGPGPNDVTPGFVDPPGYQQPGTIPPVQQGGGRPRPKPRPPGPSPNPGPGPRPRPGPGVRPIGPPTWGPRPGAGGGQPNPGRIPPGGPITLPGPTRPPTQQPPHTRPGYGPTPRGNPVKVGNAANLRVSGGVQAKVTSRAQGSSTTKPRKPAKR